MIRHFPWILALPLCLLACAGRGPECPVVEHGRALRWQEVLEGDVEVVYDGLLHSRDPHVSHLIEVSITAGPKRLIGQTLAFPYDEWATGKPPPGEHEAVVFSPAQWVAVDPRSMGRPAGGY